MNEPVYIHLNPGDDPPRLESAAPFKAVVIVEDEVTPIWRAMVSDWLVRSGCRYMMSCGRNCSAWDTSVDDANHNVFGLDPSDNEFVMTTWHKKGLEDALWFSVCCADHPSLALEQTYILHIAAEPKPAQMLEAFRAALEDE